jgi:hypothetical protein
MRSANACNTISVCVPAIVPEDCEDSIILLACIMVVYLLDLSAVEFAVLVSKTTQQPQRSQGLAGGLLGINYFITWLTPMRVSCEMSQRGPCQHPPYL